MTPLDSLALSRGTVDRLTEKRSDPEWLDAAWADPATRVLVVSDGQALVRIDDEQAALVLVPPDQAPGRHQVPARPGRRRRHRLFRRLGPAARRP